MLDKFKRETGFVYKVHLIKKSHIIQYKYKHDSVFYNINN